MLIERKSQGRWLANTLPPSTQHSTLSVRYESKETKTIPIRSKPSKIFNSGHSGRLQEMTLQTSFLSFFLSFFLSYYKVYGTTVYIYNISYS